MYSDLLTYRCDKWSQRYDSGANIIGKDRTDF